MKLKPLIKRHRRLIEKLIKVDTLPVPALLINDESIASLCELFKTHSGNMQCLEYVRSQYFVTLQHSLSETWRKARKVWRDSYWEGCIESTRLLLGLMVTLENLYTEFVDDFQSRLIIQGYRLCILIDYRSTMKQIDFYFSHRHDYNIEQTFRVLPDYRQLCAEYYQISCAIESEYDAMARVDKHLPARRRFAGLSFFKVRRPLAIQAGPCTEDERKGLPLAMEEETGAFGEDERKVALPAMIDAAFDELDQAESEAYGETIIEDGIPVTWC